jgi:hypothetical protein
LSLFFTHRRHPPPPAAVLHGKNHARNPIIPNSLSHAHHPTQTFSQKKAPPVHFFVVTRASAPNQQEAKKTRNQKNQPKPQSHIQL